MRFKIILEDGILLQLKVDLKKISLCLTLRDRVGRLLEKYGFI
jgi:hypothetical protein